MQDYFDWRLKLFGITWIVIAFIFACVCIFWTRNYWIRKRKSTKEVSEIFKSNRLLFLDTSVTVDVQEHNQRPLYCKPPFCIPLYPSTFQTFVPMRHRNRHFRDIRYNLQHHHNIFSNGRKVLFLRNTFFVVVDMSPILKDRHQRLVSHLFSFYQLLPLG